MEFIPEDEIENETKQLQNTETITPVVVMYPYKDMDHRQFEILCYRLFKAEKKEFFDDSEIIVKLMKGVQDEGQDVAFIKDAHIVGVIQCKRYSRSVQFSLLVQELVKVIMYLIKNDDYSNLKKYLIVSPDGCVKDAQKFIEDPSNQAYDIIIKDSVNKNREQYKASLGISELEYDIIKEKIKSILNTIEIKSLTSVDLDTLLVKHPEITKLHFQVNSIIDIDGFKQILEEYKTRISSSMSLVSRVKNIVNEAKNGRKIVDPDYEEEERESLNNFGKELSGLSKDARVLFSACISASEESYNKLRFENSKPLRDIGLNDIYDPDSPEFKHAKRLLIELKEYIEYEEDDDGYNSTIIDKDKWIEKIKNFCGNNIELLDSIIVDLEFSHFDE